MTEKDMKNLIDTICSGIKNKKERSDAEDELFDHVMNQYEKNIACGLNEEESYSEAVKVLGDAETIKKNLSLAHNSASSVIINFFAVIVTAAVGCFLLPAATMIAALVQENFMVAVIEGILYLVILIFLFLSVKTKSLFIPVATLISLIIHGLSFSFISVVTVFFEFITGNFNEFIVDAVPGEIYSTNLGIFCKVLLTVIIASIAVFICVYNYRRRDGMKDNKKALTAVRIITGTLSLFVAFSTLLAYFGYKDISKNEEYIRISRRYDKEYYIIYTETRKEAEELLSLKNNLINSIYEPSGKNEEFLQNSYIICYHHDFGGGYISLDYGNKDSADLKSSVKIEKSPMYFKAISRAEIFIDKDSGWLLTIPYAEHLEEKDGVDVKSAEIIPLPLKEPATLHGYQNGNAQYEIILKQR